ELHIGNYLGALKNFVELQDKYNCFFFIADYHSITGNYDPKEKSKQILGLAMDFLAAGLDPERCTIAVQSQVPEHTELAWIFNTVTPISELQRMTQFKDKSQDQEKNINMGLFDYPVLQAADILMYKAYGVPVGQDQIQHIELTRKIARFFNNKFGETFPEPCDIITKTPKIMSLTDPTKKMSKSHGSKSYIGINDEPEVIKKKMRKAVSADIKNLFDRGMHETELNLLLANEAGSYSNEDKELNKLRLGVSNLFTLLNNFGTKEHKKYFEERFIKKDIKFSELKDALAKDIASHFKNFREKRKELEKDPEEVKKILNDGAQKAREIARKTMKEVKEKIGLIL
ncbi:MAG: tryptophan--tRNA ligase, partial [Candidatus Pacebacteria bacterium]|nr:tryptophan--tRNA ligase [Candidatus Paceibacterota bacterium]